MGKGELAGRMRARLTVERWAGVPDGAGGFAGEGWQVVRAIWAELADLGEDRETAGEATRLRRRLRAVIRPAEVDTRCRLRWGERLFAVLAARTEPGQPDRMRLLIEELPA